MQSLILFIKTYKPDFERVQTLLTSIEKYNKENIPVVISVNDNDFEFFKNNIANYNVIRDSDIIEADSSDGWRYQQIIKAHVYKLNLCKNYLCIDSDSEFIRDFYYSDFLYDENTPYTIMHESKPFLETMENIGLDSENIFFKEALRATRPLFGNKGKEWDYGPSPYLWSCKVWEHFVEVYLKNENKTFLDFFQEIDKVTPPSECVIYGEYLLKTRLIDLYPVEGFFLKYIIMKSNIRLKKNSMILKNLKKCI